MHCNLAHFATLSDAALRYIIRDAAAAARAMSTNPSLDAAAAELKYLDQVDDADTILARRRAGRG